MSCDRQIPSSLGGGLFASVDSLGPEDLDFLKVLKKRYLKNIHDIPLHKSTEWDAVEHKLVLDPSAVRSIRKMDKYGGAPDVYKYSDGVFYYGDLNLKLPRIRRGFSFDRVEEIVKIGWGSDLLTHQDYEYVTNVLDIPLDSGRSLSWLSSGLTNIDSSRAFAGGWRGLSSHVVKIPRESSEGMYFRAQKLV